jgi:hypothetical protein
MIYNFIVYKKIYLISILRLVYGQNNENIESPSDNDDESWKTEFREISSEEKINHKEILKSPKEKTLQLTEYLSKTVRTEAWGLNIIKKIGTKIRNQLLDRKQPRQKHKMSNLISYMEETIQMAENGKVNENIIPEKTNLFFLENEYKFNMDILHRVILHTRNVTLLANYFSRQMCKKVKNTASFQMLMAKRKKITTSRKALNRCWKDYCFHKGNKNIYLPF